MSNSFKRALSGGAAAIVVAASSFVAASQPAAAQGTIYLVATGDSYPAGSMGNDHRGYPEMTASLLSNSRNRMVPVNRAVGGWTTNDVLYQFAHSNTLAWMARANTVVITIGANDVLYAKPDAHDAAISMRSYQPAINRMQARLNLVLAKVSAARHGNTGRVVVTGYNEIYNDGPAQTSAGAAWVRGSDNVTKATNAAIMASCRRYHMDCVDPFSAFQTRSVASYVIPDGTHLSTTGHRVYANMIVRSLSGRR